MHASRIAKLELVPALDFVHADVQGVRVQGILQDREGLRSEVLGADRLISITKLDAWRRDVAGRQHVLRQA